MTFKTFFDQFDFIANFWLYNVVLGCFLRRGEGCRLVYIDFNRDCHEDGVCGNSARGKNKAQIACAQLLVFFAEAINDLHYLNAF